MVLKVIKKMIKNSFYGILFFYAILRLEIERIL